MIAEPLNRVLEATGYLANREPAASSVTLAHPNTTSWLPSFAPDAWWRSSAKPDRWGSGTNFTVYFKFVHRSSEVAAAEWQREIWNRGFAPLLWIVSPDRIELYNGFGAPQSSNSAADNLLQTFRLLDEELVQLDALAGRLSMETGQFWRKIPDVNRESSVADRLLRDLRRLESDLVNAKLDRAEAQGLIGRSVFTQYLIDRGIVTERHLLEHCGRNRLPEVLFDPDATGRLFSWLKDTFNGDMFPSSTRGAPAAEHLARVARFLRADDTESGQLSLFPYRFDVIPVGLISSIYEQFVHSAEADSKPDRMSRTTRKEGIYYTPITAVSLVLDEVLADLRGDESVLDLTCGSGIFLVEALRRLAYLKSRGNQPSREMIRETLYEQIYGVDKSGPAVRVAAFSLYLAALELDPDPTLSRTLAFRPLVGRTLLKGDAHDIEHTPEGSAALTHTDGLKKFDVIVGNPPWTFKGKAGTAARRNRAQKVPLSPRGEGLDFVRRAMSFAHERTRFGLILSATPFFSRSSTGRDAVREVIRDLSPVTLVNLSNLSAWLFREANMPAIALLARHNKGSAEKMTLVQTHWSESSERSHTIEVMPSEVTTLPFRSWERTADLFKAALVGRRHDLLLLDELSAKYAPLGKGLSNLDTRLHAGLQTGKSGQQSARFLRGVPFARTGAIRRFSVPSDLPAFGLERAQWPRSRKIYRAPLMLVQENIHQRPPRPTVAVTERDVVYGAAYFGAPFGPHETDIAYLVGGILSSAVASWYLLMAGSSFGVWKRRAIKADIAAMPVPGLRDAVEEESGKRIVELMRTFHADPRGSTDWEALDTAVFDLYGLDPAGRLVVQDGLVRASWQWGEGRRESTKSASTGDCCDYARAFLSAMDTWLSVSNRRRMRAEVFDVEAEAPIRVIRFALEKAKGPSIVTVTSASAPLRSVLKRIGERARVPISSELVGKRELRVHSEEEVSIIKPSARRHWLGICGLEDADTVLRDSLGVGSRP